VAAGLRARLALFEAAGFLAHHGPAVHPHDLALREAGLTGSFAVAAMTGRLKHEAPWTMAEGADDAVADDHLVAYALAYARHWRRLAELATLQPLKSVETLASPLSQLGAHLADDETTDAWITSLPGPAERPGLLAACAVMATGLPGTECEDRLDLAPSYVAASLWRRHGYGRSCALPFWSAPVSRIDALARKEGGEFDRVYLDCVAEAAQRGIRELDRLQQAGCRIAALPGTARSRLHEAGVVALREPLVTARLLARKLDISTRAGLDIAAKLIQAGVLREITGRDAWRAFALA
jgi:HTH DNA binding domain